MTWMDNRLAAQERLGRDWATLCQKNRHQHKCFSRNWNRTLGRNSQLIILSFLEAVTKDELRGLTMALPTRWTGVGKVSVTFICLQICLFIPSWALIPLFPAPLMVRSVWFYIRTLIYCIINDRTQGSNICQGCSVSPGGTYWGLNILAQYFEGYRGWIILSRHEIYMIKKL